MKIGLVVPGGVDRSGTERVIPVLLWLIERLGKSGDEVHVFALNQEREAGEWTLLGAKVHNAGRRLSRLRSVANLQVEHRRAPFDVIHAFWAGAPGQVAMAFSAAARVPVVVTLPGGDLARLPDIGYGAQLGWRGRTGTRLVLSRASAIVAPTDWIAKQAGAQGWRTITIPFGVALDRWPPQRPRRRQAGCAMRMLHVASLNRVKDQFGLLEALHPLAKRGVAFTLDIVGEDTLQGTVQRHCSMLGLGDRVTFHGFAPTAGLRRSFERADLLVMNSRHEAAGIVVLEAAVAGIPTVGTSVGILADWAPDAAVAVPVKDTAALTQAMARMIDNEDQRMALARAAHARAIAYDADRYAAELRRLYADVAAR